MNREMMRLEGLRIKCAVLTLAMLLAFPLTGCWDIKYLDELSIINAIGMDASEDGQLQVTVQVVNPTEVSRGGGKGGGGGASPVTTFSEKGKLVSEAIRKISNKTSRRLYFSHNQILVIGEELARKGIGNLFEYIERDPEIRTDFYVLIAKGAKASDVMKIATPVEKIPGTELHDSIENVERSLGTSYGVSIEDIIEDISSEKIEIATGSVEIAGDEEGGYSKKNVENIQPKANLKLNGIAVFKDNKLIDFFNLKQSRGAALVLDKIANTIINIPCSKQGNIAVEVIHSTTTVKAEFHGGRPSILIKIKQEANIDEAICPAVDISDKNTFFWLERQTNRQLRKELHEAINHAQLLKSDIFGFANTVYKANPGYWKANKTNWEYIFSKLPIRIDIHTEIRREGTRNKSYFEKNQS
jgi:spore germination protein KC